MSIFQQEFDRQLNAYSDGCISYKDETAREEHCAYCENPCDDYLEHLDNDELIDKLASIVLSDEADEGEAFKTVKNEILFRMKK